MEIYGLVLAGGKSRRMGKEKGGLYYHPLNQVDHSIALLGKFCKRVFVSCRRDQKFQANASDGILWDTGQGPAAGLRAAHRSFPTHGWLTLPCDMPDTQDAHLRALLAPPLLEARCFRNPMGFLEPLLALWTPAALHRLEKENSPRVALEKSIITAVSHPLPPSDIDTPEERVQWQVSGMPNLLA